MRPDDSPRPAAADRNGDSERWKLVERIAASRPFARAAQLREMLLFVSRRVLLDHAQEVTEAEIARKVLGRSADFDPRQDNIVRVQARHLRSRLEEYFNTDGRDEPLILTIPKRSYLPQFEARPPAAEPSEGAPRHPRRLVLLAGVALACIVALLIVFYRKPEESAVRSVSGNRINAPNPLLARIFRPAQTTSIVIADSALTLVQDYTGGDVSLEDYLKPEFVENLTSAAPDVPTRNMLRSVFGRYYLTSLGDAVVVAKLAQQSVRYGSSVLVRSARHLDFRDLKDGNFVLVGGPRAIPWVELFQDRLNFSLRGNPKALEFWFENRKPQQGEAARYGSHLAPTSSDSHAVIALVPGPGNKGDVLLLMGIVMDSTEAAAEFVERASLPPDLSEWLKGERHYCEILVHTRGVAGETWTAELVSYRKISSTVQQPSDPGRAR